MRWIFEDFAQITISKETANVSCRLAHMRIIFSPDKKKNQSKNSQFDLLAILTCTTCPVLSLSKFSLFANVFANEIDLLWFSILNWGLTGMIGWQILWLLLVLVVGLTYEPTRVARGFCRCCGLAFRGFLISMSIGDVFWRFCFAVAANLFSIYSYSGSTKQP